MKKEWLIVIVIILIIVGSIGSAYMLRSVGSLSIDIDATKKTVENFQETNSSLEENMIILLEDNEILKEKMDILLLDNEKLNNELLFLKEIFIDLPGVLSRFGGVKNMGVGNGYIEFEIDKKEWLYGEEAMTYVIEEFDLSIEEAVGILPNGFYVKDLPDDGETYRMSKESFFYMDVEGKSEESSLTMFISKVNEYESELNYPLFHFYVIENNAIEVIEKHMQ